MAQRFLQLFSKLLMTCFCHNLHQNVKKMFSMWLLTYGTYTRTYLNHQVDFFFRHERFFSFDKDNRSDETHFLDCFALLDPIIAL